MAELTEEKIVPPFQFKQFQIVQDQCAMKVGTDGILLGAWADITDVRKVLDIGTGSGVIAIMLAQRTEEAVVHGIEIEENAFQQAAENMANSPWTDRLKAIHNSIQTYSKLSREEYDLIVSNPPFFSGGTFSLDENKKNVRHTVKLPHGDLFMAARKLLAKNGKLCLVLPLIEGLRIKELARSYRLFCTKITRVKARPTGGKERLLLQFEKDESKELLEDELLVYAAPSGSEYSEELIALTKDFYLNN